MQENSLILKAKEVAFDSLFHLFTINFSWMDTKGYVLGCNRQVLNSLHLNTFDEIIGKHTLEVASELAWKNTQHVIATGDSLTTEEIHQRPNADPTYFLSLKSPMKSSEGEVIGVVSLAIDITEQKLKENALSEAISAAQAAHIVKMEFIRNMEHDLRTPFSGVWGLTSLLWAEETDTEKKELLGAITECAKELLDYCNELLDFTKIDSGNLPIVSKKFDLMTLLDSVMKIHKPIAIQKKLEFQLSCDPDLPTIIIGDPRRLSRVLIHLVSNAIKFTHHGNIDLHVTQISAEPKACILRFSVKDTGVGFSLDQQEYIYEKFTRLQPSNQGKYKGLGLGLRIVKQFMEEMEGEIDLVSELEKGTTFYCTLPFKLPLIPELVVDNALDHVPPCPKC